jgi:hypothetical protein
MRRVAAKFVPCKTRTVSPSVRSCLNFLKNVTGDETWVCGYDIETKTQSSQWVGKWSPRTKKGRRSRSNVKEVLIRFFDGKGVVHHEFVPRGQTVSGQFYLERLREAERRERSEGWRNKTWMLHHNNAPHTSLPIREFLAKHETTVVPKPPYSRDLAPAAFFFFCSQS